MKPEEANRRRGSSCCKVKAQPSASGRSRRRAVLGAASTRRAHALTPVSHLSPTLPTHKVANLPSRHAIACVGSGERPWVGLRRSVSQTSSGLVRSASTHRPCSENGVGGDRRRSGGQSGSWAERRVHPFSVHDEQGLLINLGIQGRSQKQVSLFDGDGSATGAASPVGDPLCETGLVTYPFLSGDRLFIRRGSATSPCCRSPRRWQ